MCNLQRWHFFEICIIEINDKDWSIKFKFKLIFERLKLFRMTLREIAPISLLNKTL